MTKNSFTITGQSFRLTGTRPSSKRKYLRWSISATDLNLLGEKSNSSWGCLSGMQVCKQLMCPEGLDCFEHDVLF